MDMTEARLIDPDWGSEPTRAAVRNVAGWRHEWTLGHLL
jgi:hypothetical protein